jgi:hypothetical protein
MVFAVMATDTDEVFECPWYGCGADTTDKGGNKAITSAEKYFLLKLLKIPTEKDPDADSEEKVTAPTAKPTPAAPPPPKPSELSQEEKVRISALAKLKGITTPVAFSEFLAKFCPTARSTSDLSRSEFTAVWDALSAMPDVKKASAA